MHYLAGASKSKEDSISRRRQIHHLFFHLPPRRCVSATMMSVKPVLLHFKKFDSFADLPSEDEYCVQSEVQTDCTGHKWYLELYPGGIGAAEGWVGWNLWNDNNVGAEYLPLDARFSLAVKDADGAIYNETDENHYEISGGFCLGDDEFMRRAMILERNNNILKDDALCIDVTIQVKDEKHEHYRPESKIAKKMLKV